MKKFKFTLDKVLTQRQISADIAARDFAEAQALQALEVVRLNDLTAAKNSALDERATLIRESTDWVNSVAQINNFVIGQDLRIKNQNLRLLETDKLVESRREILRQRLSEVKIIEKLEVKQKKAYVEKATKAEQAELDELSVIRYSRVENLIKGDNEDGI